MKIYSYQRCSTCRKALKWLDENNLKYDLIDILDCPPSKEDILEALSKSDNPKKVLNTSGLSYREIGSSKINLMNESELSDKMFNDPRLIKRPFLITDRQDFLIGFKPDIWSDILIN